MMRNGARTSTTGSPNVAGMGAPLATGMNGVCVRTRAGPRSVPVSARRTTSSAPRALGPMAVRTSMTESSAPSNSGIASPRPGVTKAAEERSATTRWSPSASCSLAWARAKPRFQLGSHCAVIVASAARIAPMSAVAMRTSISVNPAIRRNLAMRRNPVVRRNRVMPAVPQPKGRSRGGRSLVWSLPRGYALFDSLAFPAAQTHRVDLQDKAAGRLDPDGHRLWNPARRLFRVETGEIERQHVDTPIVTGEFAGEVPRLEGVPVRQRGPHHARRLGHHQVGVERAHAMYRRCDDGADGGERHRHHGERHQHLDEHEARGAAASSRELCAEAETDSAQQMRQTS